MSSDFAGQRITVMGLGRFGGGAGVVRWLAGQGAHILLTDLNASEHLRDSLTGIAPLIESGTISLRLGEHRDEDFRAADLVIANPAVPKPWANRFLNAAREAGVPVTTEIRLLVERLDRDRVIGVTGSAGKSTTAAMIHHILRSAGVPAHLGGNIGGSLLGSLASIARGDWIVLELSSAMLHWLDAESGFPEAEGWSPRFAVLTNLEPNHLDWHGDFSHYERSKRTIFRHQRPGDAAIDKSNQVSGDGCQVSGDGWQAPDDDRFDFKSQISNLESELSNLPPLLPHLPGGHNRANARTALEVVALALGIDSARAATLLDDFRGLPHRLQLVAERDEMRFYNDSKSTTPRATVLAVEAFDAPGGDRSRVHLIAGGYDKGIDLAPIAALAPRLAGLYTIGATGERLAAAARAMHEEAAATFHGTLDRAANAALDSMKPGDILLLSPGCASWDQFTHFEERGEAFERLVKARFDPREREKRARQDSNLRPAV